MLLSTLLAVLAAEAPDPPAYPDIAAADRMTVVGLKTAGLSLAVGVVSFELFVAESNGPHSTLPGAIALGGAGLSLSTGVVLASGFGFAEAEALRRHGFQVPHWAGITGFSLLGAGMIAQLAFPYGSGALLSVPLGIAGISLSLVQAQQSHRAWLDAQLGSFAGPSPYRNRNPYLLKGRTRLADGSLIAGGAGFLVGGFGVLSAISSVEPVLAITTLLVGTPLYLVSSVTLFAGDFLSLGILHRAGYSVSPAPAWAAVVLLLGAGASIPLAGDTGGGSLAWLTLPLAAGSLTLGGVQLGMIHRTLHHAADLPMPLVEAPAIQVVPTFGWSERSPVVGISGVW